MKKTIFVMVAMFVSTMVWGQTYKLENSQVRFEIDSKGRLVSLKNLVANREYTEGGKGLWQIIYQEGASLEEILLILLLSSAVALTWRGKV